MNGKADHHPVAPPNPPDAPPEPKALITREAALEDAVQRVLGKLPDIIDGLAEQSAKSHQHARFLFEFAGIAPGAVPPEAAGPSLAEIFLDRLGMVAVEEVTPPAESADA